MSVSGGSVSAMAADQPGWMSRFIDYFVVCGLGTEVKTVDNQMGFLGVATKDGEPIYYVPDLFPLDFYPQKEHRKFCVPEGLSMVMHPSKSKLSANLPH